MGRSICILNLTRIGDLIQTTPLIAGLRAKEPDARITILANAKFAGILRFVDGVDEVIAFNPHRFGSRDGAEETDTLAMYEYLDTFTAEMKDKHFDLVINLSHSKLSAMMAYVMEPGEVRGFMATPRGTRLIHDPWLVYFSSFLAFRKYNRFNLVDMYMRGGGVEQNTGAGLRLNVDSEAVNAVNNKLLRMGIQPGETIIGIQAGASREDRRWNPASFAAVADHLSEKHGARIALFGAESEKTLGDEVEANMKRPAINLIGQTGLGELVAWVKRLGLLITNDTGTMHIAAAVGTPVVALFFVHARCEETGPYCKNALVIQADIACAPCTHQTVCDHYSCLQYITPEDVIAASESFITGDATILNDPSLFKNARLYASGFDAEGFADFIPLRKPTLTINELFAYLYRPIFGEAIIKWGSPENMSQDAELIDDAIGKIRERFATPAPRKLEAWMSRAIDGAVKMANTAAEGTLLAMAARDYAMKGELSRLGGIANELARIDEKIAEMADTHETVGPLAYVYKRRVENFTGDNPVDLAEQAGTASLWLAKTARLFANAAEHALESLRVEYKTEAPVSINGE